MNRNVSVTVVTAGQQLLMGKRRDTGKWCVPGGRQSGGESPQETAMRELYEEAGIIASGMIWLKTYRIPDKDLDIHVFHTEMGRTVETTTADDPDHEMSRWEWVDISEGLPVKYKDNLHRDLDLGLHAMGLL